MSKRTRRNLAPAFKAKVALAAVKGEKTLTELPRGGVIAEIKYREELGEPSGLAGAEIATAVFNMSDRTIGSITKIVRAATVASLHAGRDRITLDTLKSIGITSLSGFKVGEL